MLTFVYVRKQQPNKATIKQKKQALTFRVTWSNVIFIYFSGHSNKKKQKKMKQKLKVHGRQKVGPEVLTIPHTDPYTEKALSRLRNTHQRDLF